MEKLIFYLFNFIGITVYYLFNRKTNVDSPLLMLPYFIALFIIFCASLKFLLNAKRTLRKSVFNPFLFIGVGVLVIMVYSINQTNLFDFDLMARLNSFRRYFGCFLFFFAFVAMNFIRNLEDVKLKNYIKFVIVLVGIETMVESLLLNLHVVSHLDLPVVIGAEYLGATNIAFRPYGFLGSTTSLGVFLLCLFFFSYALKNELPRWVWLLSFTAFAITFSTTAYVIFAFICFCAIFFQLHNPFKLLLYIITAALMIFLLYHFFEALLPGKLNMDYVAVMLLVFTEVFNQYVDNVNGMMDVLFGAQSFDKSFGLLSQDLPYISWIGEVGLVGMFLFSGLVIKSFLSLKYQLQKKYIYAIIATLFLGMLHYPIFVFIPTQIFMGCIMFFALRKPSSRTKVIMKSNLSSIQ